MILGDVINSCLLALRHARRAADNDAADAASPPPSSALPSSAADPATAWALSHSAQALGGERERAAQLGGSATGEGRGGEWREGWRGGGGRKAYLLLR